jgi:hypothetical protein
MGDWGFVDVLFVAPLEQSRQDLGVEALPVANGEFAHQVGDGGDQFGGEAGATEGAVQESATGTGEPEQAPRFGTGLQLRDNVGVDLDVLFDDQEPLAFVPELGEEKVVGVPR